MHCSKSYLPKGRFSSTLNIIIVESEITELINLLNKLVNTSIDGVIIQDLGLFYILSKYFKKLKIHASTQLTTHNEGQINFLSKLNATQVNLSRELNIYEIKALTPIAYKSNILTEIFVHGSYCISFSGICYMSSVLGGKSGNRGRCSQPCRDRYLTTAVGKNYPLNLKDNSAYFDLKEISEAGINSIKIEGRIKKLDYVFTVVNSWKNQLQSFYYQSKLLNDNSNLYKVFNRDFSNSFLKGDINKDMFIDNPRDNSIKHLSIITDFSTNSELAKTQIKLYEEKDEIKAKVENKIKQLSIAKVPLTISISGNLGLPLTVCVKTPDKSFNIFSEVNLVKTSTQALNPDSVLKRLKALNETEYYIKHLDLDNLEKNVFIAFKELTSVTKRILFILNDSKEIIVTIDVPVLKNQNTKKIKSSLSVLISSNKDLKLYNETSADIYFQLPNCFKKRYSEFLDLFRKNIKLIPWFPSVLIGENFTAAVDFLQQLNPKNIVTNNTGIAYECYKIGIPWIAGPFLNIVNSFSLLCIKEEFNCSGSFISNEINKNQIKSIINPENFKLYYSIYHPIVLMTSRQCLFHTTIGCEKHKIDVNCIQHCEKSSIITNLKNTSLFIEKTNGNFNCIYNNNNFLNTDIISDLPDIFSSFFIDLRDIKTETKIDLEKIEVIKLFENLLNGNTDSKEKLNQIISPTTMAQYKKGI